MAGGAGSKGQTTRDAILQAAAAAFRARGYGATTLDDVAGALNLSRQALLYHFQTKDEILDTVVAPYLDDLFGVLSRYQHPEKISASLRRQLIIDFLDATTQHPVAAGILFRDVTSWEQQDIGRRVRECNIGFRVALTGDDPTTEVYTVATSLLGALIRPLIDPALDPNDPDVRAAVLDTVLPIAARIDRLRRRGAR
jgi:AcrR family transcriptional regulator